MVTSTCHALVTSTISYINECTCTCILKYTCTFMYIHVHAVEYTHVLSSECLREIKPRWKNRGEVEVFSRGLLFSVNTSSKYMYVFYLNLYSHLKLLIFTLLSQLLAYRYHQVPGDRTSCFFTHMVPPLPTLITSLKLANCGTVCLQLSPHCHLFLNLNVVSWSLLGAMKLTTKACPPHHTCKYMFCYVDQIS